MTAQSLIGWDIFYFTSTTSFEISRVAIICFPVVSEEVLLVFQVIRSPSKVATLASDWSKHFWFFFQKNYMLCHQTFQKCFFRGSNVFLQWRKPHFSCMSHRINYKLFYIHILHSYLMGIFTNNSAWAMNKER